MACLFPFGPPPLWSLRNDFHWAYWGVWVEREVEELFPSVCLSVWTKFNLPDKMDVSKGILPSA